MLNKLQTEQRVTSVVLQQATVRLRPDNSRRTSHRRSQTRACSVYWCCACGHITRCLTGCVFHQNNLERANFETRTRLEAQLESAQRELALLKSRAESNQQHHKHVITTKEVREHHAVRHVGTTKETRDRHAPST